MKILLVAATEFEVNELKSKFKIQNSKQTVDEQEGPLPTANYKLQTDDYQLPTANCKLLVTGVGMVATAYALGRELATNNYDLAINLGIAGSFDRSIALGEVVEVITDTLAELGAEDDTAFLPIEQMGFGESRFNATCQLDELTLPSAKKVTGITVNTVHGNEASIQKLQQRLNAQTESMEGAAFFYACGQAGVPCMQLRAISNYVEKRNRDAWQIGPAIKNLNTYTLELLAALNNKGRL